MFNLQGSEIIFILLLALVVLGPEKLPSAIRRFTQTYAEIRKMGTGFQSELKSALDEPMREMKETAGLLRDSADPAKAMAEAERDAERKLRAQQILDREKAEKAAKSAQSSDAHSSDAQSSDAQSSDAQSSERDRNDPSAAVTSTETVEVPDAAPDPVDDVVDEWADPIDLDDTAAPDAAADEPVDDRDTTDAGPGDVAVDDAVVDLDDDEAAAS